MSAGWHVNEKGEAGKCEAKVKCPFGDESVHFTTEAAARKHYEKLQEEKVGLNDARKALEEYGADSKVFASWGEIHPDFKTVASGERRRMVMVNGGGKGAMLVPWHGPKVLERLHEAVGNTSQP